MVNYNNGKIYKIEAINGKPEDIYIGSTTLLLCKRMAQHREGKCSSKILFEKYGVENCKIILIENVNVNTKEELLQKEAFYIRSLECVNKQIPLRTKKEYKHIYDIVNKQKNSEYNTERYFRNHEENKIKGKEAQARFRETDSSIKCICGGTHDKSHKSAHLRSQKHQKFINNII